ncbi:membrane protein of unknown function [Streptantibioticus cattleyicolor NRRL 8057 = DSM 46488]|nr:membrane protein of unknown function [Streptantibioticus cattleyicolor NRRL 8057 = DSM 46488]
MPGMASPTTPDPPVPRLPVVGTTWYRRGVRYWLRRASIALFILLFTAFFCFIAFSLYQGFRSALPPWLRPYWDWAEIAATCVTLPWGWIAARRQYRKEIADPPTPEDAWRIKRERARRGRSLAVTGRALLIIAAPVMPAFAGFFVAQMICAVTVPRYPSELGALKAMAAAAAQRTP